jgi:hypothetical protein
MYNVSVNGASQDRACLGHTIVKFVYVRATFFWITPVSVTLVKVKVKLLPEHATADSSMSSDPSLGLTGLRLSS